jgi:hypothetical protein
VGGTGPGSEPAEATAPTLSGVPAAVPPAPAAPAW